MQIVAVGADGEQWHTKAALIPATEFAG